MRRLALTLALALAACDRAPVVGPEPAASAGAAVRAPSASASPSLSASAAPAPAPGCPKASPIGQASPSPDGATLVTACAGSVTACGDDGERAPVDVWSLADARIARTLDAGLSNVIGVAWDRRGWLATVGEPTTGAAEVHLYDTSTWQLHATVPAYCLGRLVFSPSGGLLAFAFADGQVRTLSTRSFEVTKRPVSEAHLGGDYGVEVRFGKEDATLIVEDEAAGVQVLSTATLKRTLQGPLPAPNTGYASSPDATRLVTCDEHGALAVLESRLKVKRELEGARPDDPCTRIAWLSDSRVLVGRRRGEVALWDAAKHQRVGLLAEGGADDAPASFVADDARTALLVQQPDGLVRVFDLVHDTATPRLTFRVPTGDAGPRDLVWSPTGAHFAAALDDRVTVWDAATGNVTATSPIGSEHAPGAGDVLRALTFSPDGKLVIATDGAAHLIRVADGASVELDVFPHEGGRRRAVAFSARSYAGDAALVACAAHDGAARTASPTLVADLLAGRPVR